MDQVKKILFAVLSKILNAVLTRKNVGIYFCFAALYILLTGLMGFAVLVLAVLQGVLLLILTRPNAAIKSLSHRMVVYIYKMLRYITLCEAKKPYPFGPIPEEIEPADDVDLTAAPPEKNFFDRAAGTPAEDAESAPSPEGSDTTATDPASPAADDAAEPIPMGHSDDTPPKA
jgi:hypothetical protein